MDCPLCQRLETDLERLRRIHAERVRTRESKWQTVGRGEYGRIKGMENDAILSLEIVRAELNSHVRSEHQTG